jgi:hypothetical protein
MDQTPFDTQNESPHSFKSLLNIYMSDIMVGRDVWVVDGAAFLTRDERHRQKVTWFKILCVLKLTE